MRMLCSTGSKDTSSKDIIYYVKIRIQGKYSFSANQPSLWSQLVSEATGRLPPGHNGGTSRVCIGQCAGDSQRFSGIVEYVFTGV
jgi:hypothetical protein